MSRSFSLEEQSSLFSRESSLDPSSIGPLTSELRLLSHEEPRSEGYDEYFDPPLESKYECPICLLGLREPVQTSCGHRFCRGCIVRSIRYVLEWCRSRTMNRISEILTADAFHNTENYQTTSSPQTTRPWSSDSAVDKRTKNNLYDVTLRSKSFRSILRSLRCQKYSRRLFVVLLSTAL